MTDLRAIRMAVVAVEALGGCAEARSSGSLGEGGCEFAVGTDVSAVQGAAGSLGELE
jgi:hypothetical protein